MTCWRTEGNIESEPRAEEVTEASEQFGAQRRFTIKKKFEFLGITITLVPASSDVCLFFC